MAPIRKTSVAEWEALCKAKSAHREEYAKQKAQSRRSKEKSCILQAANLNLALKQLSLRKQANYGSTSDKASSGIRRNNLKAGTLQDRFSFQIRCVSKREKKKKSRKVGGGLKDCFAANSQKAKFMKGLNRIAEKYLKVSVQSVQYSAHGRPKITERTELEDEVVSDSEFTALTSKTCIDSHYKTDPTNLKAHNFNLEDHGEKNDPQTRVSQGSIMGCYAEVISESTTFNVILRWSIITIETIGKEFDLDWENLCEDNNASVSDSSEPNPCSGNFSSETPSVSHSQFVYKVTKNYTIEKDPLCECKEFYQRTLNLVNERHKVQQMCLSCIGLKTVISVKKLPVSEFKDAFLCPLCHFRSLKISFLQDHVALDHKNKSYPCPKCNYEATRESELKKHYYGAHVQSTTFKVILRWSIVMIESIGEEFDLNWENLCEENLN